MRNILLITLLSLTLFSCKKDGDIKVNFSHEVNGSDVEMNEYIHFNDQGQTFGITKLEYYVTDIRLVGEKQSTILANAQLIDLSDPSTFSFSAPVASGKYNKLEFQFGLSKENNVESFLENSIENQNMFWPAQMEAAGEKGAYHYMKLEGRYQDSSAEPLQAFIYHAGPTNGADNSFKLSLDIDEINIAGNSFELAIKADLLEWFQNPTSYNFNEYSMVMMNQATQEIYKANGKSVFSFYSLVENE